MYNFDYIIFDGESLPKLESDDIKKLLSSKTFSKEERDTLIIGNIRLVLYLVYNKFQGVECDRNDLVQIGTIGLIKAVDTFNAEKGYKFSSYASRCICNEILMFLRKNSKIVTKEISMDTQFDENRKALYDKLFYLEFFDNSEEYFCDEIIIVQDLINELDFKDKEIIMSHFGLNNKRCTQKELAKKYNVSQGTIHNRLIRALNKIRIKLEELREKEDVKTKKYI